MRIALVTDAWRPQVNGVVTTLSRTVEELERMGHPVLVINPMLFKTFPLPTYPEIKISIRPGPRLARMLDDFLPDRIHIATEGTLGMAGRRYCKRRGLNFTTSYHTQFPEYLRKRLPIPVDITYAWLRGFHGDARQTMIATRTMRDQLTDRGFGNLVMWERGVDTTLFRPRSRRGGSGNGPIWVYAGRIAVEKNLDAFLELDLPGTKRIIGDGPQLQMHRAKYPKVEFLGYRFGEELAVALASGDVFVFPSLTDTYGLVMLEAMACGLPVAAFPVTGPIDVIRPGVTGVLSRDLREAALGALRLSGEACRAEALTRTWYRASEQFASNLVPA